MLDYSLLPFFTSVLLLILIVLAVGIHFWRNVLVMAVIIPVALFSAFSGYTTITNILGYPITQAIPKESLYLYHIQSEDGAHLYVYAVEPEKMLPKNFKIDATEQNKKSMSEAGRKSEAGVPQAIRPLEGNEKDKRTGVWNDGAYQTYNFQVDPLGQKQYNSTTNPKSPLE